MKKIFCALLFLCFCHSVFASTPIIQHYKKGYRFEKNGWVYVHIEGKPYERGYQHGYLLAPELKEVLNHVHYLTYQDYGKKWQFFVKAAVKLFLPHIDKEYITEMKGIADGAKAAGANITWQEILAWNGLTELTGYWWPLEMEGKFAPEAIEHCSAFIAVGDMTKDHKIIMAHSTFDDFAEGGVFDNIILEVVPDKGHHFIMQTEPGYLDSNTDFFETDAGLIGTETTIGGFSGFNPKGIPEFIRARKAMQYADTLDDFVRIMLKENNGADPASWLLGNNKTGEIMRFELGLKYHSVAKKKDGYFIGFNAAEDPRIRNIECKNTGYFDVRRHQGARRVRLTQLMKQYQGKIDLDIAKKILADHYDVYLKKNNPSSRTVDAHYELDARAFMSQAGRPVPFTPHATIDGKVTSSNLSKNLSFWARWGSPSGMSFNADQYLQSHSQWQYLKGYITNRPTQPWVLITH